MKKIGSVDDLVKLMADRDFWITCKVIKQLAESGLSGIKASNELVESVPIGRDRYGHMEPLPHEEDLVVQALKNHHGDIL